MLKEIYVARLPNCNDEQLGALNDLIKAVLEPEILAIPNPVSNIRSKPTLETNKSDVLFLDLSRRKRKLIDFWSRELKFAEQNYSATEKECLDVVYGMMICLPNLFGQNLYVYSDQEFFKLLLQIADQSGILIRWRMRLTEFNFEIQYEWDP